MYEPQFSPVAQLCPTFCDPMNHSTPGLPVHHQFPDSTSHLILCRPLSSCPQSLQASGSFPMSQLFAWGGQRIGVSASASVLPLTRLISFRMDWLDLHAVQGTLKSPLQHHSSKASIFQCSALFTVQLSHPYMTTGKTIALTRRTFVGKAMSLLFNILSRGSNIWAFLYWHQESSKVDISSPRLYFSLIIYLNVLCAVLNRLSCVWLCDPMDCSPPSSSVHGTLQAKILERIAKPSFRGSSRPGDQTHVSCGSCTAGGFFTTETPGKPSGSVVNVL